MLGHILENIIGYAAIGLFGIGIYEFYLKKPKVKIIKTEQEHEAIAATLKELNEKEINKSEAYKNKKDKVYEIISKRNPSGSNSNGADTSERG